MADEDEGYEIEEYTMNPDMVWATRIDSGTIRVYISESRTLTFSNEAAQLIVKALKGVLEAPEGGAVE